jgi:hypothetical protein
MNKQQGRRRAWGSVSLLSPACDYALPGVLIAELPSDRKLSDQRLVACGLSCLTAWR